MISSICDRVSPTDEERAFSLVEEVTKPSRLSAYPIP